jgi:hypothetical protein
MGQKHRSVRLISAAGAPQQPDTPAGQGGESCGANDIKQIIHDLPVGTFAGECAQGGNLGLGTTHVGTEGAKVSTARAKPDRPRWRCLVRRSS